jgi:DNA polymerase III delta prime subunit
MERDMSALWCEEYRPSKVADTILPKRLKDVFRQIVSKGTIPNMIFSGSAGLGKTTVAKAICNELEADYILINGSDERNIDTLRTKIRQFASTVSLSGGLKVVILDEADYLNPQSTQPALRGFIEEFSGNCRFILTCNFKNKIIDPLHSRCSVYDFVFDKNDMPKLCSQFFKRLTGMLDDKSVEYEPKTIAELIQRHAPDWRRTINECQRYAVAGKIDDGIFINMNVENFNVLIEALHSKNFKTMRKWVANNLDIDPSVIYRRLYDNMNTFVEPTSTPQLVLLLADYDYKGAFVSDQELNLVACMTEIMAQVKFK